MTAGLPAWGIAVAKPMAAMLEENVRGVATRRRAISFAKVVSLYSG
jgi:hypothetical protein